MLFALKMSMENPNFFPEYEYRSLIMKGNMQLSLSLRCWIFTKLILSGTRPQNGRSVALINILGQPGGEEVNKLDGDIIVSGFELKSCYYILFPTKTL